MKKLKLLLNDISDSLIQENFKRISSYLLNSGFVTSVFGRGGDVKAEDGDYTQNKITGLKITDDVVFKSLRLTALTPLNYVSTDPTGKLTTSGAPTSPDPARLVEYDITCDPSVYVGAWVYWDGVNSMLKNGIGTSFDAANVIGVCQKKSSSVLCDLNFGGVTKDLYTGLTIGRKFLSDTVPGGMQDIPITTSGNYDVSLGLSLSTKRVIMKLGQPLRRL